MDHKRPAPEYQAGARIHGYVVKRVEPLPEKDAVFYELKHDATGARHAHVARDDRDNAFSVAFKTVPRDSTGVAHILEHTALCGSEKYPVRDPFFSMIRRSMNSFMNAFTASDWTMYPYATQNRADYYNLMKVYLDAAFFPLLDDLSFKQEGHRLEFESANGGEQLVFKGVVYNEMKGAMSSRDQVMVHSLMESLYPDTTYGNNSGGDPVHIIELTHQQLLDFHARHYHPSNAWFYTYGDMPLEEHLGVIESRVLNRFSAIDPKTGVRSQPRFTEPRQVRVPYPVEPGEEKKHEAAQSWLLCGIEEAEEVLALELLEKILLGNASAPLRKALIDSGLGSSVSDGTGYDSDNRDTMFSAGLKDVSENHTHEVGQIVLDTLAGLVEKGVDPDLVETAIHQYEFQRREVSGTPFPYGLKLFLHFCGTWFHGGDPLRVLRFEKDLAAIRERAAAGPYFEGMIRAHFLENPHRVFLDLYPDPDLPRRQAEQERSALDRIEKSLAPRDIENIRRDAKALEELQDREEDLSCLPTLRVEDIPPEVESVPASDRPAPDYLWPYEAATNGILYYTSVARIDHVPAKSAALIPFLCHAYTKMGTKRRDYADLSRTIARTTGGMGMGVSARTMYGADGTPVPFAAFDARCLSRNVSAMFDLAGEILFEHVFDDLKRLRELLLEYRAAYESRIVNSGHMFAMSLASRGLSPALALQEQWSGVHQLLAVKELAADLSDEALRKLAGRLSELSGMLFAQGSSTVGLVGSSGDLDAATRAAGEIRDRFRPSPPSAGDIWNMEEAGIEREGWSTSTSVSFVAHAVSAPRTGHPDAPVFALLAKLLRSAFLHKEIREKGGAYGGFARSDTESGVFHFGSYRDPHIARTLDVYRRAYDFLREGKFTEQDVKESILQTCSDIDKPDPPGQAARKAFFRRLLNLSDDMRTDFKKGVLATDRSRVVEVAEKYFQPGGALSPVAVISNETLLRHANEQMGDYPLSVRAI
ncbi:MAG: insulinase family protein [Desulfatibacillaceae bacterium]